MFCMNGGRSARLLPLFFLLTGKMRIYLRVETPKKGLNIIRMSDGTVKKVVVK